MALDPQNVPIPLAQGLDTKSDPKQIPVGKLSYLKNASFKNPKELRKRDGFSAKSANIIGGGSISAGLGVQAYKNELVQMDGSNLYSYSPSQTKWQNKGALKLTSLTSRPVVRNTYSQSMQDCAYDSLTNLTIFTWVDASVGVGYSIFDNSTNLSLISSASIDTLGTKAKVLLLGTNFVIIYYDGTNHTLRYKTVSTATPTTLSSATTIASDISSAHPIFDAEVIGGKIYIAYSRAASVAMYSLTSGLVLSSQYVQSGSSVVANCISVIGDGSNNVWVAYDKLDVIPDDNYNYYVFIASSSLAQVLAVTFLAGADFPFIPAITGTVSGTTATYLFHASDTGGSGIYTRTINTSGTTGSLTVFLLNCGLASKEISYGGTNYFLACYPGPNLGTASLPTSIEQTYFVINSSASVVAKIAPGNAGGIQTNGTLPEVPAFATGQYLFTHLYKDDLSSNNGNVFYNLGVQSTTVNLSPSVAPSKLVAANALHVSGGQLQMYDGANIVEHGFHVYPENISLNTNSGSGGGIGFGTSTATVNQVQYVAVYEWADNYGQIHRSAASPALTVQLLTAYTAVTFTGTMAKDANVITSVSSFTGLVVGQVLTNTSHATYLPAGTTITELDATNSRVYLSANSNHAAAGDTFSTSDVGHVIVEVPTLTVTAKSNVSIALYRTAVNQTIFYRTSSLTSLTYSSKSTDSVLITDTTPDAVLIGNEQLYTTGGVVDNIGAPASNALLQFKNRPLLIPSEQPVEFWYGQQIVPGSPAEFSDLFTENIDNRIGAITAAGVLDDKIILFGSTSKYYIAGDGPSPSGANNDFTEAVKIVGTTGCQNQASIIETPIGLFYQDPIKGIWLLDRSLQEQFIGADVAQYNSSTITSSQLFADANKVLFTLSDGTNLSYDYFVGQWETDIYASAAIDSTVFQSNFTYVQSNGLVQQQTPGTYSDNGSVIPLSFKTGPISFAGIEGFQRVWELQILGTYRSPHTLTVNIYSDFSATASQTVTIPVLTEPVPYQFRIILKPQVCEAIQVEIIETQSGSPGEGLSVSSLGFRVGVKRGQFKLPAGASY